MSIALPRHHRPPPPDPGGLPVIWTVSVSRLTGLLGDVIPEFDSRARIVPINLGFAEAVDVIGQRLKREHCDVVIAGGSNAAYLRSRLPVPLVPIQANGFDLMEALARARRISPRIGLVTHASDVPTFTGFQRSFGLDIEHRRFVTREDARDVIADLHANGIQVIVGTGMAIDYAEQVGLPGVLLYSADSVRQAFEHALELTSTLARTALALSGATRPIAPRRSSEPLLLGDSAAMQEVRERIALYAPHDSTVLISGATGTGKELVARQLHAASGRRGRFVAVNCGALSESLLESELFGYSEGAFTGARRGGRTGLVETADGGTLFLDEIGELPLVLQTRLLRVLEEREVLRVGATEPTAVDLRVVAATLQDLPGRVRARRFRDDLYYRLSTLSIQLPSLAQRREDIPVLLRHFFKRPGHPDLPLQPDAVARLQAHGWPGNVRELRNIVERLRIHLPLDAAPIGEEGLRQWVPELDGLRLDVLHHGATGIDASDLDPVGLDPAGLDPADLDTQRLDAPSGVTSRAWRSTAGNTPLPSPSPSGRVAMPSRDELRRMLMQCHGNRAEVGQRLGISRTTLWRWLRHYDLQSAANDTASTNTAGELHG